MDKLIFHFFNFSVTTNQVNDYLNEHSNDTALVIDKIHGVTPLHILSINPHDSADTIATIFNSNMEAIHICFVLRDQTRVSSPTYLLFI